MKSRIHILYVEHLDFGRTSHSIFPRLREPTYTFSTLHDTRIGQDTTVSFGLDLTTSEMIRSTNTHCSMPRINTDLSPSTRIPPLDFSPLQLGNFELVPGISTVRSSNIQRAQSVRSSGATSSASSCQRISFGTCSRIAHSSHCRRNGPDYTFYSLVDDPTETRSRLRVTNFTANDIDEIDGFHHHDDHDETTHVDNGFHRPAIFRREYLRFHRRFGQFPTPLPMQEHQDHTGTVQSIESGNLTAPSELELSIVATPPEFYHYSSKSSEHSSIKTIFKKVKSSATEWCHTMTTAVKMELTRHRVNLCRKGETFVEHVLRR
jgi:hypothetical protein